MGSTALVGLYAGKETGNRSEHETIQSLSLPTFPSLEVRTVRKSQQQDKINKTAREGAAMQLSQKQRAGSSRGQERTMLKKTV